MSLKDLLPPGTYDEIEKEAWSGQSRPQPDTQAQGQLNSQASSQAAYGKTADDQGSDKPLTVACPYCKKPVVYSTANPFRPFCSERCKMLDLGAWANEERTVAGNDINIDEDADLLNDPNLPLRNIPEQN